MSGLIARVTAWALSLKPVRVWFHYAERRGFMLADSITYRALFSVFAAVLLGFTFAALWLDGNPAAWQALIDAVDAAIPGLVGEDGLIKVSAIEAPVGLTLTGILSLVGLVGAAIGAIGSLRAALRTLADELHDDVFWIWVILRNLLLALAIGGGLVLSAAATFYGSTLIDVVGTWVGGDEVVAGIASQVLAIAAVFALDAGVIALGFVVLSGVRARARVLWPGALLGAVALTVLQQLSGLFVRGAGANPLFASFAALIALLIWFNLSAQVVLLASTWIIVGVAEERDPIRERHGAPTFALRRVQRAEDAARVAVAELELARAEADREREAMLAKNAPSGRN
ncbi:YihY/virulence factor BrkB family protein [Microbacterium allomyrinae]|jgi:membrane protein|uniref:YihY/virulence factor BrkB family protein n=1 Tax=Microbacterium allomyrinae TaxID=2830666 RepID=A0A9X1LUF7_9MICO|nr:YihY/virulence factor BrkB family protein [Microbacterium allomyrinae]MCC2031868.1 YihY/virulence factor BrkB family protein [Microbacterium allomyrinae]